MNKKRINFVYITTNLITGKQYVGDHSSDNLNDGYLGSGIYLNESVNKYGRENFKRDILQIVDTKEEAFNLQQKYITEYDTLKPNGYNISPTGGHGTANSWSDESRKKLSKSHTGMKQTEQTIQKRIKKCNIKREETKKKQSQSLQGHTVTKQTAEKISNALKGKKKSLEHIKHLSESHKGHKVSEETRKKQSNSHKGKIRSKEHCKNLSKSKLGSKHSEETKQKIRESKRNKI